jgi:hypothetical protein
MVIGKLQLPTGKSHLPTIDVAANAGCATKLKLKSVALIKRFIASFLPIGSFHTNVL